MSLFLFLKKIYRTILSHFDLIKPESSLVYRIICYPYNKLSSVSLSHFPSVKKSFFCKHGTGIISKIMAFLIIIVPFADTFYIKIITAILAVIYYLCVTVYEDFGKKPSTVDVFIYLFYLIFMPVKELYWLFFYIVFTASITKAKVWNFYGIIFLAVSAVSCYTSLYFKSDINVYSEIYALYIPFGIAFINQAKGPEKLLSVFLVILILVNYFITISKGVFSITTLLITLLISLRNFRYYYILMLLSGLILNFSRIIPPEATVDIYSQNSGILYILLWTLLSLILVNNGASKKPILRSMLAAVGSSSTAFAGKPIAYTGTFSALFWIFLSFFSSSADLNDD